ncbi:sulfite exporter TauE/SafE family protein [Leucobacter rhizosphaerae]|uniref:Probable membrane transporter protein n=1 Tax=Leucobacter rhizosphaerae TaxID=2932245 RepID=A0ABY4FSN6_9MICO|nr:sulfite exporter TauE/SafE family protein [Leucobacter rhizosphaerae]UOQ59291.1 sulfite exporter TauE/SafE family protein [Leucobacter rhizosphaerae]
MTSLLPELPAFAWALLGLAAVIVGFSKTALPGINTVSIAIFAALMPARESTGALLVLLIVGDIFAVWSYRAHASWPTILRLAPAVVGGMVLGTVFLALADDGWVRRVIGGILLMVVLFTVWRRWISQGRGAGASARGSRAASIGYGSLSGFTTMVANAGGPVMSMYFLAARFPVKEFLGTAAWFFAIINVAKLPFSVGLGLIDGGSLLLDALLIPGVIAGAFAGRWVAGRVPQRVFESAVLVVTVLGALYLLLF